MARPNQVRLAELVASLSLATDLGLGQPEEHVLRQTVIATRLGAAAGFSDDELASAFYVSLLAWVGCIADSHELARWYGDDRQVRADSYFVDKSALPMMRFLLGHLTTGTAPLRRVSMIGQFLAVGLRDSMNSFVAHCQTTGDIAQRLGIGADVARALPQAFARWDGKGVPSGLRGEQIEPTMRLVQIADDAEVFHRMGGTAAVAEMLRARRGTEFDPALVDVCLERAAEIFGDLDAVDAWGTVIDGCAALDRPLAEAELEAALTTCADYADLKSPWFVGHSRAVGELVGAAAPHAGLDPAAAELARSAGFVHRLGAIGVSTGIWNKPGPLTPSEWERVRTVPYLTERVLCRSPRLAPIGALAATAYERMDGSGYPRGLSGAAIPPAARVLAAAQVYQSLCEPRPHRAAFDAAQRQAVLLDEAANGRLDADAVRAVLGAAGHRVPKRRVTVAGLTEREIDVLALLVRGWSNKQIATHLSVSSRTVGSHVEHIYAKIGVSTRGAAAMYAMRHGLVDATAEPGSPSQTSGG